MRDDRFARIKFRHAEISRACDEHGVMPMSYERELLDMIAEILNATDDAIAGSILAEREACAKIADRDRQPRLCIYPKGSFVYANEAYDSITAKSDAIAKAIRARNEDEVSSAP